MMPCSQWMKRMLSIMYSTFSKIESHQSYRGRVGRASEQNVIVIVGEFSLSQNLLLRVERPQLDTHLSHEYLVELFEG